MKSLLLLLFLDFAIRVGWAETPYDRYLREQNEYQLRPNRETHKEPKQPSKVRKYYQCIEVVETVDVRRKQAHHPNNGEETKRFQTTQSPSDWTTTYYSNPIMRRIDPRLIAHVPQRPVSFWPNKQEVPQQFTYRRKSGRNLSETGRLAPESIPALPESPKVRPEHEPRIPNSFVNQLSPYVIESTRTREPTTTTESNKESETSLTSNRGTKASAVQEFDPFFQEPSVGQQEQGPNDFTVQQKPIVNVVQGSADSGTVREEQPITELQAQNNMALPNPNENESDSKNQPTEQQNSTPEAIGQPWVLGSDINSQAISSLKHKSVIQGRDSAEDKAAEVFDTIDEYDGPKDAQEQRKINFAQGSSHEANEQSTESPVIISSTPEEPVSPLPFDNKQKASDQLEAVQNLLPKPIVRSFSVLESTLLPTAELPTNPGSVVNDRKLNGNSIQQSTYPTPGPASATIANSPYEPKLVGRNLGRKSTFQPIATQEPSPNQFAPRARFWPVPQQGQLSAAMQDVYRLSHQQCTEIKKFAKGYGINDVVHWVRNNCEIAQLYFPNHSCEQMNLYVGSCVEPHLGQTLVGPLSNLAVIR